MAEGRISYFDLDLALEGLEIRQDASEVEKVVKSLGEQIKLSQESIEREWIALTDEAQISLEKDPSTIRDFAQYLEDKVELEGHFCNTEAINLNVFLTNVVQALERNIGDEEKILDELTSFASEQGFILPLPEPETRVDTRESSASLNVVLSESEEATAALWGKIRHMISQGLIAGIDNISPCQNEEESEKLLTKKVQLLEKMCILYTPSDVWRKYLLIRQDQVKKLLKNPASLDIVDAEVMSEVNIPSEATCLIRVSHMLDKMFEEDCNLVALGMFPDAAQIQPDRVYNVYLKDFHHSLQEVVKYLHMLGRRGSVNLGDYTGNTLSSKIFLALRQCVLAASSAESCGKKFLRNLQSSEEVNNILEGNFGSTFSISSISRSTSQVEVNSNSEVLAEVSPGDLVRDEPEDVDDDDHIWSWQEEFKPVISKLALAITGTIQSETRSALQKELKDYEKSHSNYEAVEIPNSLDNDTEDYPKMIAKSCSLFMSKIMELSPFLLLKPDKEFEAIRNSFIESLTTTLMAYQSRLSQISSDVPRSSPLRNLYVAFNSAVFIQLMLKKLAEDHGIVSETLSSVYNDLVESLNEKILSYHCSTIATVVLQDVQSHHWMNQKDFFEGERCSFSVQMWNYYMQGFQHDLWLLCPSAKAQEMFTSVVQYSLSCFVRRYSKALPSYRRTKLFRSDITAILFSVSSWMIFPVSSSATDIFTPRRSVILDIHNSCSTLLAIMTIVTCPLETLCLFTSGRDGELIKEGKSSETSWLSWLQPELYGEHTKSIISLNDIQAVNLYFKLMINQPNPSWQLVLQTVLLRDSYLAVTIVTYLESHLIHVCLEQDNDLETRKSSSQLRSQCVVGSTDQDCCTNIVGSLYYVILKCSQRSKSLVNFMIALINRENSWQMFTSTESLRFGNEEKIPVWLQCLYFTFKPFLRRLTDLVFSTLSTRDQGTRKSFKFTSINSLPCGCNVRKQSGTTKQTDETKLVFEAFEQVLKNLSSTVCLLPKIILKLFNRIEDDLCQLKITTEKAPSAGVKLLGSMLYRIFSAEIGFPTNDKISSDFKTLAHIIYYVMVDDLDGLFETCDMSIALESLIKNKADWIKEEVGRIGNSISEMDNDEQFFETSQDNFQEMQYGVQVKSFFLDCKGEKALKHVYNFFLAKKNWILRRIPLVSHLGPLQHPPNKSDNMAFNPLYAYNNLGGFTLDHEVIENFPFDWEKILQSNIGMSLKSLKRLVYNRCELQNEKDVEEDKLELVEKLKTFYEPESDTV